MMDLRIGLSPLLLMKVDTLLGVMNTLGYPMRICQGVRTVAQQATLYAQGRTTPGKIVTNCDGVHIKSNHQPRPDGFGYAVDCCFSGKPDPFALYLPWRLYGEAGKALGLRWGGEFKLVDLDHLEMV